MYNVLFFLDALNLQKTIGYNNNPIIIDILYTDTCSVTSGCIYCLFKIV